MNVGGLPCAEWFKTKIGRLASATIWGAILSQGFDDLHENRLSVKKLEA